MKYFYDLPFIKSNIQFLVILLFIISCGNTFRNDIKLKETKNNYYYRNNLLNEIIGIDSILCMLIDHNCDSTILDKNQYDLLSDECQNKIKEYLNKKGMLLKINLNNVEIFFPIPRNCIGKAKYLSMRSNVTINKMNPSDLHGDLYITINSLMVGTTHINYSLKLNNGKIYIDKCTKFSQYL
jgi:hypothetical protein